MIEQIISWLYPAARPVTDWLLADDGNGPQIVHWDEQAIGAPEPTVEEVMAHEADWRLDTARRAKIEAIDARSLELLTAGLEVAEGKVISTSPTAQHNLTDLMVGVQTGLTGLPQGISTVDGDQYIITDETDLMRIAGMWAARKKEVLDAGRALRIQVLQAETLQEVEAVTDTRT